MSVATAPLLSGSPPIPRTRLIGRDGERASACAYLLDENVPLLTLTGPGGVGKTRLALAIADDVRGSFADGVIWVDLAPIAAPSSVPAAIAAAVGLTPTPQGDLFDDLRRALHSRQTLLLLDNCEHLLPTIATLAGALLPHCPTVQVLATSRAPLRVRGEQEFPIDPLPLPPDDTGSLAALAQNDAVRLFTERARAVHPTFVLTETNAAIVAALCRQLDGLPLAIELAAARSKFLTPEALLTQMAGRLQLLDDGPRDAPTRQRMMRDTIAWSYGLLSLHQQRLLRRLAVFAGGFTIEAAQAVSADAAQSDLDLMRDLAALVDHSLVRRVDNEGESRFTMLETIRAFGLERLQEAGEEAVTRDAHAAYFIA